MTIARPDRLIAPHTEVAPATHPVELRRLALEEAQHPDCDPLSVQVVLWVLRASSAVLGHQAEILREPDLSPSAFNVLMALRNTPGGVLEPCDIADRLLVTRPSVTGLLDTLENKGLIERRPHPADRRRRLVHLTASAHEVLTDHLSHHYAELERLLGGLGRSERAELITLLRKIDGAVPSALLPHDADDPDPDHAEAATHLGS
jgi:DNA-binding MarR family transcriptional regulator